MGVRRDRARILPVVAAIVACLLTACTTPAADPEPTASAARSGTGEVRHDLEPLTDRFIRLDTATAATWMSGTLGDDRVPGPSTYWIDAIVTLDEADYAALQSETDAQDTTDSPAVDAGIEGELPDGPFLRSDELDALFSPDGYWSVVFLHDATRTVILSSRFE
ncbi:hypothetical protein [Labedella endophytica]|uniref:Uncharacterized protein n=1 Tax=Labedella endophytica TaxID=1523160 RepID=A0A3S0VDY3_9MICO|nr:hypothetical protein [Labedella endophytica]RUQ98059.1 hypothetical protein ELQ94_13580 [Labedella endophytica]